MRSLLIVSAVALAMASVAAKADTASEVNPFDDPLMNWQRGINETRTDRLLALAPTIMPDCDISASKEDIAEFYVYWRFVVREEIERFHKLGWPLVDPDEEQRHREFKQMGMIPLRQYQLTQLVHVGPEMPHANEAVVHQIEIWKALHCVVEKYGASKFFSGNGSSKMGMDWPWDTILNIFGDDLIPIDPEKTKEYLLPNMEDIEPLDALGRLFREAETRGSLTFPNEQTRRYFFERYESNYFYDMTNVSKARAWFHTPPWMPGAPHLERPTRPIPSHAGK